MCGTVFRILVTYCRIQYSAIHAITDSGLPFNIGAQNLLKLRHPVADLEIFKGGCH